MNVSATHFIEVIRVDQTVTTVPAPNCCRVITWTQSNTSKYYARYHYILIFNLGTTGSSGNSGSGGDGSGNSGGPGIIHYNTFHANTVYLFAIDDNIFPFIGLDLAPGSSATVTFTVPDGISAAEATLVTYVDNAPIPTATVRVVGRSYIQRSLHFWRELVPYDTVGCCSAVDTLVATVGYRGHVEVSNYDAFLYSGGVLTLLAVDAVANNREVVVFINSTQGIDVDQVLHHLLTSRGILPHRAS